jgi:hypothetical protein
LLRAALRILAPALAIILAIDWIVAPATLTIEGATRLEVSAELVTPRRTRPYAYMRGSNGQEVQVPCDKTARLCESLGLGSKDQLTVWIVEPGLFYGTWLVAADDHFAPLVPIELQNQIYRGARALSAGGTLAATALALFIWRKSWLRLFRRQSAA